MVIFNFEIQSVKLFRILTAIITFNLLNNKTHSAMVIPNVSSAHSNKGKNVTLSSKRYDNNAICPYIFYCFLLNITHTQSLSMSRLHIW